MMQTHLTVQDLMKYLDTSDLSEEYLLWMEKISGHLTACERCQEALHRAMEADCICEEEGLQNTMKLASQEEEIRRSILICKLQKLQQQERMAEVIQLLQKNATVPYVLQMADLQRRTGIARGKKMEADSQKADFSYESGRLVVRVSDKGNNQKVIIVLEQKDTDPIVCEALWDETEKQWTADFELSNPSSEFEIYIL